MDPWVLEQKPEPCLGVPLQVKSITFPKPDPLPTHSTLGVAGLLFKTFFFTPGLPNCTTSNLRFFWSSLVLHFSRVQGASPPLCTKPVVAFQFEISGQIVPITLVVGKSPTVKTARFLNLSPAGPVRGRPLPPPRHRLRCPVLCPPPPPQERAADAAARPGAAVGQGAGGGAGLGRGAGGAAEAAAGGAGRGWRGGGGGSDWPRRASPGRARLGNVSPTQPGFIQPATRFDFAFWGGEMKGCIVRRTSVYDLQHSFQQLHSNGFEDIIFG